METVSHAKSCRNRIASAALVCFLTVTTGQAIAADEPRHAWQVDVYQVLDHSRRQLEESYPGLSSRELDVLVFRIADVKSLGGDVATTGPAGDWICRTDAANVVRLTMRAKSYVLVDGSGRAMGGEYERVRHDVDVASGPLKGMGISHGTLVAAEPHRVLDFVADNKSALTCREVL